MPEVHVSDPYDELVEACRTLLSRDQADKLAYDVAEYSYELATADNIVALAKRRTVKPLLLINVGDPLAAGEDTTGRVWTENVPVEIIVAAVDLRSVDHQLRKARALAQHARTKLSGQMFTGEAIGSATFAWQGNTHIGTTKELTLYAVLFTAKCVTSVDPA